MTRYLVQVLAGASVGWLCSALVFPTSKPVSPQAPQAPALAAPPVQAAAAETRIEVRARGDHASCADAARIRAELDAVTGKLEAIEAELASLRAESAASEGRLQTWPDSVDPVYREAAFAARLEAEVAAVPGVETVVLDCGEYPCLFTVEAAPTEAGTRPHERVLDAIRGMYPDADLRQGSAYLSEDDDGSMRFGETMALIPPEGLGDDGEARLRFRFDTSGR